MKIRYCLLFLGCLFLVPNLGCKKVQQALLGTALEQYFEQTILNSDFTIQYAKDRGTDITNQYNGFVFRLLKNTYYDGPMTAVVNGTTYTGTWSCTSDFGKLTIDFEPGNSPPELAFVSRSWRFIQKAIPLMKFGPWGSTEATELHMLRQ